MTQLTGSLESRVVPEAWINELQDRVLTPFVKPDQVVIDEQTAQQFDQFDTRARAHAIARGEHDALLYLHIYAIWNNSLWRAKYDSWEDYCDEWDKMPLGISKSSIKHKMADIKRLFGLGATTETIVLALGNVPTATRNLLQEVYGPGGNTPAHANREFLATLPGGDVNAYLGELAALGPIQANMAVDELAKRHNIYIVEDSIEYDPGSHRLFFVVTSNHPETGILTQELFIPNVPEWVAKFLAKRLVKRG